MDSARFRRVAELFDLARQLPADQREEYLNRETLGDIDVKAEVLELLRQHDLGEGALDRPPPLPAEMRRAAEAPPLQQIGHYRIIRKIGEGGMGAVFEAEQENPRRTVALKIIHPGFVSQSLLRRFEHEAQILGRLHHPGIAQIFEAGTFDSGAGPQPFFAMEFVRGEPLNSYAERCGLSIQQRLELIARISDAVQHAHHKGIIHRDLKPSNILVVEEGPGEASGPAERLGTETGVTARGLRAQPKILDFGVARATDSDIQTTTLRTDIGQLLGTIPYMSPEQASGDAEALDTRSDVYALGVVAYELLAGRLPYNLERKLVHEAVRVIREEEPTRLSSIKRTFRGDIETIIGKALEKDRTRRYQTASDLAEDIRRYLRDETVIARPPSRAYQLRKFAKRHKALVAGVCSVMLVLIIGIITTTLAMLDAQASEIVAIERKEYAEKEKEKATAAEKLAEDRLAQVEKEKAKADAVVLFQQEMLVSVDPRLAGTNRDITVREVLDEAAKKIEAGSLKDQPEVEGAVRYALGITYFALGLYPEALKHLEKSLELRRKTVGDQHLETAESLAMVGETYRETANLKAAVPLAREALAIREKISPDSEAHAESLNNVALIEKGLGNVDECIRLNEQALAVRRKLLGNVDPDIMQSLNNLAMIHWTGRGDTARAIQLLEECLDVGRKLYEGDSLYVASSMQNLAQVYDQAGEVTKGIAMMRDALQMRRNVLGEEHDLTGQSMNNLAAMLKRKGDLAEAEPLYRRALEIRTKAFGPNDPRVAETLNNLGTLLHAMGRYEEAEESQRQALAVRRKSAPGDNSLVALYLTNLGNTLTSRSKLDEAEQVLLEGIEMRRRLGEQRTVNFAGGLMNYAAVKRERGDLVGAEALQREGLEICRAQAQIQPAGLSTALNNLGSTLRELGRLDEAQVLLEEGLEMRKKVYGEDSLITAVTMQNLGMVYADQGKLDDAEAMLRGMLQIRLAKLPPGHLELAGGMCALGRFLLRRGNAEEAEQLLREGLEIRREKLPAGHTRIAEAALDLGGLLLDRGDSKAAEPLLREAAASLMDNPSALVDFKRRSMERMIQLCESTGDEEGAQAWRSRLDQAAAPTPDKPAPADASP